MGMGSVASGVRVALAGTGRAQNQADSAAPALDSGFGGSWGDYDNDGYLDLFVANRSVNNLYHNNGDGTFTKVKSFAGAAGNGSWSGSCCRDLRASATRPAPSWSGSRPWRDG